MSGHWRGDADKQLCYHLDVFYTHTSQGKDLTDLDLITITHIIDISRVSLCARIRALPIA